MRFINGKWLFTLSLSQTFFLPLFLLLHPSPFSLSLYLFLSFSSFLSLLFLGLWNLIGIRFGLVLHHLYFKILAFKSIHKLILSSLILYINALQGRKDRNTINFLTQVFWKHHKSVASVPLAKFCCSASFLHCSIDLMIAALTHLLVTVWIGDIYLDQRNFEMVDHFVKRQRIQSSATFAIVAGSIF